MFASDIKVLLIEGDRPTTRRVRSMLSNIKGVNFELKCVDQLSSGLECLEGNWCDVVLLDLFLSDSQGIETYVKAHAKAPDIPIVLLTDQEDEILALKTLKKGAQEYLIKRYLNRNMLPRVLRYALERGLLRKALHERTHQLRISETRLANIIEKSADGIVVVDKKGLIRFVNQSAESIFARKSEELLGELFGYSITVGKVVEVEISRSSGKGPETEMRAVETQWEEEDAYLVFLHDISEHKQMLEKLDETRKQQLRVKNQFISHISHELRSPLTAIHQFVTILLDRLVGDINSEQQECLEIALRNVDQLNSMIADLLEVTRIDVSSLSVHSHSISLRDLITETVITLGMTAKEKKVNLSADIPEDLPFIYADPTRVREILHNLIENGIKFNPEKGKVHVRAYLFEEDPDYLCVEVEDTGCGIGEEGAKHIFERMYQEKSNRDASRVGLGLGLYICKELVSRQGGDIWFKSEVDKGSVFCFTLPIFSMENLLYSVVTATQRLRRSVDLISIEVSHSSDLPSTSIGETMLRKLRNHIQECIPVRVGALLPKVVCLDDSEVFFAVINDDEICIETIIDKIKRRLESDDDLAQIGIKPLISHDNLILPFQCNRKTLRKSVKKYSDMIEEQVTKAYEKRKNLQ